MAVTITSADLIEPLGQLDPTFFPDRDLNAKIEGWFNQAKAKVESNTQIKAANQDDAVRQWSYYLAFTYLAGRYASMPSSTSVNKGADAVSYAQDRPAYWSARATLALGEYNGFLIGAVAPKSNTSGPVQVIVSY